MGGILTPLCSFLRFIHFLLIYKSCIHIAWIFSKLKKDQGYLWKILKPEGWIRSHHVQPSGSVRPEDLSLYHLCSVYQKCVFLWKKPLLQLKEFIALFLHMWLSVQLAFLFLLQLVKSVILTCIFPSCPDALPFIEFRQIGEGMGLTLDIRYKQIINNISKKCLTFDFLGEKNLSIMLAA